MLKSTRKGMRAMGDSEAKKQWMRENTRFFGLKLNRTTDEELIAKLEEQESIQGYIKDLIRKDVEREKRKAARKK